MTFTVNQILIICLIAVLVVFLIIMACMAGSAIGLLKNLKGLTKSAKVVMDKGAILADDCKDKVKAVADKLVENASIVDKAIVVVAAVLAIANYRDIIRKHTFLGKGAIGAYLDKRDRKKAQKEYRKTKKEVAKLRKATRKEARASRKATAMARAMRNK